MRRLVIIPLVACLVLGAFPGLFAQEAQPGKSEEDNGYAQISIFAKTLELLRQDYVDENKTSYHDLVTAAMKGMLSSLDPHSQFMDPSDFRDMQDDTRSRFNGLGIEVSMKNGLPTVITAMEDTPAAKAGILSGDQILRINGISTERMDLQDAINVLRGPAGAKVTLTLLRPSTNEIKEYTLQRAEIKIQSVKGASLLDPDLTGPFKIGYIRLIQFNEPTAEELSKALDDLQKQGMQALILDLRNNPGGLLNSAVDVCAQFLPPNTKVVSTQGRVPSQQHDYSTSGAKKERPNFPMVLLINEGSASGAEIVADCTGIPDAVPVAMSLACDGGQVVIVGSPRGEAKDVNFYDDLHRRYLEVTGAHGNMLFEPAHTRLAGTWDIDKAQNWLLAAMASGRLNMSGLVTHPVAPPTPLTRTV